MNAGTAKCERARRDIIRVIHRGLDPDNFARAVTGVLGKVIPHDGTCLLTIDPSTMLPTGEVVENGLPAAAMPRLTEIELRERDFNKFTALARGRQPAASLSQATGGDLQRSLRQRELRRPNGFADELRVVCRDEMGVCGALTLLRAAGRPDFTLAEVRFAASLAGSLADGLRRTMLLTGAADNDHHLDDDGDIGVILLAPDDTVEMANRAAEHWLDELGAADWPGVALPIVIRSVAGEARTAAGNDGGDARVARARVRTRVGRWVVARGSVLGDGPQCRVAIVLEAVRPPELAPLIADAYGFTERERAITELVAQGFSTNGIAGRLHLSAYTVQDHLKSIFDKSGAGSRGDLVARLFFDHYAPRLSAQTPDHPAVHADAARAGACDWL